MTSFRAVTFTDPCYLISGIKTTDGTRVYITILLEDGTLQPRYLSSDAFTVVQGSYTHIVVTPAKQTPKVYYAAKALLAPRNSWGIVQHNGLDNGLDLSLIAESSDDLSVNFLPDAKPVPSFIEATGAPPPNLPLGKTVWINDGSVWNGLDNETLLSIFFQEAGGAMRYSTPARPGDETGPILKNAVIFIFRLESSRGYVDWVPVEGLKMEDGMSLVVMGTSQKPYLAPMVDQGGIKSYKLEKLWSETS